MERQQFFISILILLACLTLGYSQFPGWPFPFPGGPGGPPFRPIPWPLPPWQGLYLCVYITWNFRSQAILV